MIAPFRQLTAIACALPIASIDTDQLIPARFMKRSRDQGYGAFLLHDLRRDPDGPVKSDSALDAPPNAGARILVTRRNFGTGSSREAAVYALMDFGIRCVIAPSFGDIHASNAVNNGLLPAQVTEEDAERLLTLTAPGGVELTVDLAAQEVVHETLSLPFRIDPAWRLKLLNGWDDIDLTRSFETEIARWTERDRLDRPWAQRPHLSSRQPSQHPPGSKRGEE
jgi:3-isopropylmalate/(R)-2-methylmalate dehydratase small subunit